MYIVRLLIYPLIFILLLSSCGGGNVKVVPKYSKHLASNIINLQNEGLNLISDSCIVLSDIVPLTSQDTSFALVHIDKIIPVTDGYIILDKKMRRVCKFDTSGALVKDFFKIGRNFGELTNVDDLAKDPNTKNIIIYSNDDYKISWFSEYGKILREKKVEFNARRMNWLSTDYLVFTTNYGYTAKGVNYNALLVDTNGKVINELMKRPKCKYSLSFSGLNIPSNSSGATLVAEPLSNNIYKLSLDHNSLLIGAEYRFNFGEKSVPEIENLGGFFEKNIDSIIPKNNYLLAEAFEAKDYLFFTLNYQHKKRWAIYDKNSRTTYMNNNNLENSHWGVLRTVPLCENKNGEYITAVDYSTFFNLRKHYPKRFEGLLASYNHKSGKQDSAYDFKNDKVGGSPFLFIFKIKMPPMT